MTKDQGKLPYREVLRLQNEEYEKDCEELREEMENLYNTIGRLSRMAATKRMAIEHNQAAINAIQMAEARTVNQQLAVFSRQSQNNLGEN